MIELTITCHTSYYYATYMGDVMFLTQLATIYHKIKEVLPSRELWYTFYGNSLKQRQYFDSKYHPHGPSPLSPPTQQADNWLLIFQRKNDKPLKQAQAFKCNLIFHCITRLFDVIFMDFLQHNLSLCTFVVHF